MGRKTNICACGDSFKTSKGLNLHKSKKDHWVYPKPIPKLPEIPAQTSFLSLVDKNQGWGKRMLKSQINNPSDSDLYLGYLRNISNKLSDILVELKRTKTIE